MILIASKNKDFSSVVAEQVRGELGLACEIAETAEELKRFAPSAKAVVTDSQSNTFSVPVVAVSAKPVRLRDILADIRQALQKNADETLLLGKEYMFSTRLKQLTHIPSGISSGLTDKEVQLLQCMNEAGKHGIGREELLKQVWGFEGDVNTHTLETHIYRLRGKLRELSGSDGLIEASEGGYRLEYK